MKHTSENLRLLFLLTFLDVLRFHTDDDVKKSHYNVADNHQMSCMLGSGIISMGHCKRMQNFRRLSPYPLETHSTISIKRNKTPYTHETQFHIGITLHSRCYSFCMDLPLIVSVCFVCIGTGLRRHFLNIRVPLIVAARRKWSFIWFSVCLFSSVAIGL